MQVVIVLALATGAFGCGSSGGSISKKFAKGCIEDMEYSSYPVRSISNSPVSNPRLLNCNFDDNSCCWSNEPVPRDQLDWQHVTNQGDLKKCADRLNIQMPSGGFMGFFPDPEFEDGKSGTAQFSSCPMCTTGNTVMDMRIWRNGANMRVCKRDVGSNALQNCQQVAAPNGNSQRFTFPPGQNWQIVVEGGNFNDPFNVAGFDDITVSGTPCSATPPPTAPPPPTRPSTNLCSLVACNFQSGPCNWQGGLPGFSSFKTYQPRTIVGNLDTGVNAVQYFGANNYPEVSNDYFLGANNGPRQRAAAGIDGMQTPNSVQMRVQVYDACANHNMKVCFDSESNCQDLTQVGVSVSDRKWQDRQVNIPAGTRAMIIKAENIGDYFCSAGISNVRLYDPSTGQQC